MTPDPILISNNLALGDAVVLTAFVRDLALAFPGRYRVAVNTPYPDVWRGNPYAAEHVSSVTPPKNRGKIFTLPYGEYIPKSDKDFNHFVGAYHKSFKKQTGVHVPLTAARPDFHPDPHDKFAKPAPRYWVVVGGAKTDFQVKRWVDGHYQAVVDALVALGIPVVQAGKNGGHKNGRHPPLRGAISLVDKTTPREFMQLIAGADGVVSPVTAAMHIAAGFSKPAIVVAGGAEEWWWEAYHKDNPALADAREKPRIDHRYLHTIGGLPCCKSKGCWKSKVEGAVERSTCVRRMDVGGRLTPQCMTLVSPTRVVESVLSYYLDGTLAEIPGMSLPTVDRPIQFVKDGRQHVVSLEVVGQPVAARRPEPASLTVMPVSVLTATEPTPPSLPAKPSLKTSDKLTICGVFYGKTHELHARWLNALRSCQHRGQFDVRIFCNAVGPKTTELLARAVDEGLVRYVYDAGKENAGKYPGMRALFHDPLRPLETEWVLWLDDDTFLDVNKGWFIGALEFVRHNPTAAAFGAVYGHRPTPAGLKWLQTGAWHKGKPLQTGGVKFLSGSCWFVRTEAIAAAGIPDVRLKNNGGDITIGEQLHQNGFNVVGWNADKQAIAWSVTPRRGLSEPGPFSLQH